LTDGISGEKGTWPIRMLSIEGDKGKRGVNPLEFGRTTPFKSRISSKQWNDLQRLGNPGQRLPHKKNLGI
jgi:hypothetical protein